MTRLKRLFLLILLFIALGSPAPVTAQGPYYTIWACIEYVYWEQVAGPYLVATNGSDPSSFSYWTLSGTYCQLIAICDNGSCS